MRLRSIAILVTIAAFSAACNPYRCLVQSRAQQFEAQFVSGVVSGRGFLLLSETRGAESGAFVTWHVRMAPVSAAVARVLLREGTREAPGRVLYEFPLVNVVPDSGVITQVFTPTPYAGRVPFAELWDLIQRQAVLFEVVFAGGAPPLHIGPLDRTSAGDWQDVCT
jgi:hypothetical protein